MLCQTLQTSFPQYLCDTTVQTIRSASKPLFFILRGCGDALVPSLTRAGGHGRAWRPPTWASSSDSLKLSAMQNTETWLCRSWARRGAASSSCHGRHHPSRARVSIYVKAKGKCFDVDYDGPSRRDMMLSRLCTLMPSY